MYIIAGLGNPDKKYFLTRHNFGFLVIDELLNRNSLQLKSASSLECYYADTFINSEKVIFCKPVTYMNLSGRCIRKLCDYYKIEYQKLIILTDDTNIDFGKIRIRKEGSAGGHNGLKSIISCLGVDKFARVRLGVGDKGNSKLDHYVLSEFNSEEKKILSEIISKAADAVETIINENIDTAMNKFN